MSQPTLLFYFTGRQSKPAKLRVQKDRIILT